jgi:hypothetical protein
VQLRRLYALLHEGRYKPSLVSTLKQEPFGNVEDMITYRRKIQAIDALAARIRPTKPTCASSVVAPAKICDSVAPLETIEPFIQPNAQSPVIPVSLDSSASPAPPAIDAEDSKDSTTIHQDSNFPRISSILTDAAAHVATVPPHMLQDEDDLAASLIAPANPFDDVASNAAGEPPAHATAAFLGVLEDSNAQPLRTSLAPDIFSRSVSAIGTLSSVPQFADSSFGVTSAATHASTTCPVLFDAASSSFAAATLPGSDVFQTSGDVGTDVAAEHSLSTSSAEAYRSHADSIAPPSAIDATMGPLRPATVAAEPALPPLPLFRAAPLPEDTKLAKLTRQKILEAEHLARANCTEWVLPAVEEDGVLCTTLQDGSPSARGSGFLAFPRRVILEQLLDLDARAEVRAVSL